MKTALALLYVLTPSSCLASWLEDHLKAVETLHLTTYQDTRRHTAIGYGHQNTGSGHKTVSKQAALRLLRLDIIQARKAVKKAISVPMTPYQYDALTSFTFNIGEGAFKRSSVAKRFNLGDVGGAALAMAWYVKSDGKAKPWLKARRALEIRRYWKGVSNHD